MCETRAGERQSMTNQLRPSPSHSKPRCVESGLADPHLSITNSYQARPTRGWDFKRPTKRPFPWLFARTSTTVLIAELLSEDSSAMAPVPCAAAGVLIRTGATGLVPRVFCKCPDVLQRELLEPDAALTQSHCLEKCRLRLRIRSCLLSHIFVQA